MDDSSSHVHVEFQTVLTVMQPLNRGLNMRPCVVNHGIIKNICLITGLPSPAKNLLIISQNFGKWIPFPVSVLIITMDLQNAAYKQLCPSHAQSKSMLQFTGLIWQKQSFGQWQSIKHVLFGIICQASAQACLLLTFLPGRDGLNPSFMIFTGLCLG